MTRQMLSFQLPGRLFQMRAAAIIEQQGHVLVHRAVGGPFWSLPGGRVEFGESTAEALVREIEEELLCTCEIGPLRFVVENFFAMDGREVHELGHYCDARLTGPFPFLTGEVCHRIEDGGAQLEYLWLPLAGLAASSFVPAGLIEPIGSRAQGFRHVVVREP